MREKLHHIHIKRKTILFVFIFMIALAGVTPVLADYLGPNRTVTETTSVCKVELYECKYVAAKDDYRYRQTDAWSCSNESKPWKAYPSDPSPWGCSAMTEGDTYWSKNEIVQEVTNTYPPATIEGALQNCTLKNGWCITAPQLALNSSEPVAGYNIIGVEGSLNGQNFACLNASCAVPLLEGDNSLTYWALSSWGDSSTMGTLTAKVDSRLPNITGTLSGTSGSNGWYVSPVSFNNSAADATSGLESFTCTLDGLALGSCSAIIINAEGAHSLVLRATDNAGNTRTLTRNASVDLQNPILNASLNGTLGSNDWYTSAALNATASDPGTGSGLSAFEYNLDTSGWVAFPGSGVLNLPEGQHTVDIRAVDRAGHVASSSKSFSLDGLTPDVVVDATGTLGSNNWYIATPTISASASDDTSGLDVFEYNLDNNGWTSYSAPLTLTEGPHSISVWAQDNAGLVKQVDRSYQVDTRLPQIAGNLSGTMGLDAWYISDVTLSASASDPMPGSNLDAFTFILDSGAPTPYTNPLTLTDGQHALQFTAQDQAGLTYSIQQSVKVDTTPPSLSVSNTLPNWIRDTVTLSGTAADTGSGLLKVQISTDDGNTWQSLPNMTSWSFDWNTQNSPDGSYRVHVRAMDKAGLTTENIVDVGLDNHAPSISFPDSWIQWSTVTLDIWDDYSGISTARIEIIDPHGHWPTRLIELDPQQFPMGFKWDRRWGDGTVAPSGLYSARVTATDNLGHVAQQTSTVEIALNFLPPGPTATPQTYFHPQPTAMPAYTATPVLSIVATPTVVISAFGAIEPTTQVIATPTAISTPRVAPTQTTVFNWLESFFAPDSDSKDQTTELVSLDQSRSTNSRDMGSQSNVLWGAAAAAAVGAATAYAAEERRKQQAALEAVVAEEEARRKQHEAKLEQDAIKAAEKELRHSTVTQHMAKLEAQRAQEAAWEQARLQQEAREDAREARMADRVTKTERQETASWVASLQAIREKFEEKKKAQKEEEEQARLAAYYNATKQENTAAEPPATKTWWQSGLDWIDNHQTEIALGFGIAVGVAAIVVSGGIAAPLVAAAITVGAGAMAATTVAAGTVMLNRYYGRDWNENLAGNMAVAGFGAAVVAGAWFTFQIGSTGLGAYCTVNPASCARVEPVFNAIDMGEEAWLSAKVAYQQWRGDPAYQQTLLELQMEHADGGMPGNSVAKELGGETLEKVAKYGDDAIELVGLYGDNAARIIADYGVDGISVLQKHGTDAIHLISTYGDDGFAVLLKFGDDAVDLVKDHGIQAIKLLRIIDSKGAETLLETLDDDVLEYASQQGDDAIAALARWSEDDLREHGIELALRAKKDAQALADVKKLVALGPLDPKNLTAEQKTLIDAIAKNSTQYADNGQIVLGKWVDFSSGFIEDARNTGSKYYGPHPDIWNTLSGLGEQNQSEAAWLVNQKVIQNGINDKLPFEFSLNGLPANSIEKEADAIEALFSSNANNEEIVELLGAGYLPVRMKELQELQKAGYDFAFDELTNTYIFTLP